MRRGDELQPGVEGRAREIWFVGNEKQDDKLLPFL